MVGECDWSAFGGLIMNGTGQPEVQYLDLALWRDLHIGRLQVTVDDPDAMRPGESIRDLDGILQS